MSGVELLIDDHHGIYIPKHFVESFDLSDWSGIKAEDLEILRAGPEHELYWETWDDVLNNAIHTDEDGMQWMLHQDGDLFGVCQDRMTAEEYKNFFGEEKEAA